MAKRNPDNLAGNRTTLFNAPGKALLWVSYISAPKGKVFKTARRARSPFYTGFISLIFWAIIALMILGAWLPDNSCKDKPEGCIEGIDY
jgi:hypothetical protein